METEDTASRILAALANSDYKWRTVPGVAKEVNASKEEVLGVILSHQDQIVRSPAPSVSGEPLFTTRDHLLKVSSLSEKFIGALKNRIY